MVEGEGGLEVQDLCWLAPGAAFESLAPGPRLRLQSGWFERLARHSVASLTLSLLVNEAT